MFPSTPYETRMKAAYYYYQGRFPKGHTQTNPYGPSLVEAMEKLGVEFEFSERIDAKWLIERRGDIDVLHLNWPSYEYKRFKKGDSRWKVYRLWTTFLLRLVLARLLGYRLVWTMHNLYPHDARHRRLDHLCRLALCVLCNSVIVHCEYARKLAAQCFGRKRRVWVVPHGHFIDVYPNEVSRSQARERLGIPAASFVYLFFGSVQPYKGIDELIRSFRSLEGTDQTLLIVGAAVSSYAASVTAQAERDARIITRFSDRTPSGELQYYFNAADAVVLPFVSMLTSGTVVLALSWKKPVIVPALGCLPELVTDEMGILYDSGDEDGLMRAMADIRTRDCPGMGESGYRRIGSFDWDGIAALTLRAYRGA